MVIWRKKCNFAHGRLFCNTLLL